MLFSNGSRVSFDDPYGYKYISQDLLLQPASFLLVATEVVAHWLCGPLFLLSEVQHLSLPWVSSTQRNTELYWNIISRPLHTASATKSPFLWKILLPHIVVRTYNNDHLLSKEIRTLGSLLSKSVPYWNCLFLLCPYYALKRKDVCQCRWAKNCSNRSEDYNFGYNMCSPYLFNTTLLYWCDLTAPAKYFL